MAAALLAGCVSPFEVVDASPVPVSPATFRFVFDASWMQLDIDVGP